MPILYLVIPGCPIAQPRQRHRVVMIRGRKPFVQSYVPKSDPVQPYKESIAKLACKSHDGTRITGPVMVEVEFHFPRPGRLERPTSPVAGIEYTSKPDVDNLVKSVLDALTTAGLWRDDAQVSRLNAAKFYVEMGTQAKTIIKVAWAADAQGTLPLGEAS